MTFPDNFLWGVATASYQIEGAVHEDGRGESIWDRFSHTPGKIANDDNGDLACDHYHRYPEDIQLMVELGVDAYRFSIAWPRIFPTGKGRLNEAGLEFYDRLVDKLLESKLRPFATLYHWDLPQALEDEGGWLNRATADHYAAYADVVSRVLGDRVKDWATFNEAWCITHLGYVQGNHAPGIKDPTGMNAYKTAHVINLAHGKAIPILRANVKDAKLGCVFALSPTAPATDSEADRLAAQRVEKHGLDWYISPLYKGEYPADILEQIGPETIDLRPGDMEIIHQPLDFIGVNYYFRTVIADDPNSPGHARQVQPADSEYTEMGWEVWPDGLYDLLKKVNDRYQPKVIYITENGTAMPDILENGQIHDVRRTAYLRNHLAAVQRAISDGMPVKGYFLWSLVDNFEWAFGYAKRFGIIYIDYPTQRRFPKDSFNFYQNVIKANSLPENGKH